MSIETFTSKAFSPLLIDLELSRVHSEEAKGTLQDEEMSVKILPNVNEVKAVVSRNCGSPLGSILADFVLTLLVHGG